MSMLFDYLKDHYDDSEPIFIEDIHIEGMRRDNFCQQLKTLTDNGRIKRYEKGIYYIPKETRLSSDSAPNPEIVAKYKYIGRNGKIDGFYSGSTFANLIGISLQVPMKKEIVSNRMSAIVREIIIGKQKFIIRRPYVEITNDNANVLQLLDLLKNLDHYLDCSYDEAREIIKKYSLANKITKESIDKYIRFFPDSTFRFFYEMRLGETLP